MLEVYTVEEKEILEREKYLKVENEFYISLSTLRYLIGCFGFVFGGLSMYLYSVVYLFDLYFNFHFDFLVLSSWIFGYLRATTIVKSINLIEL